MPIGMGGGSGRRSHYKPYNCGMTGEEMQRSIEAHDRQIEAVVTLLASLSGRLDQLVRLAEIQNARLERLEGRS
jgi:hypothetical protein